jgi:integrase
LRTIFVMADNMNDIIRRGPRRLALPLPAREPEQPTRIDLGAGPRAPLARTDLEAPLFPDLDEAALRTAITRACKAIWTPHFFPHGLRRRRGSLHYKRTGSLADVAELLGDSKRVEAEHYVYALTDYREADRSIALARVQG